VLLDVLILLLYFTWRCFT